MQGAMESPHKEEGTCEREEELKAGFPNFFSYPSESQGEIHFMGGVGL
jgi:hypothetical protein